jgi:hypothetical protein
LRGRTSWRLRHCQAEQGIAPTGLGDDPNLLSGTAVPGFPIPPLRGLIWDALDGPSPAGWAFTHT